METCNKSTIYVNELLLTLFSPFDIKCKKLNAKNLWKCVFRASRRVSFSYFPKVALNHYGCHSIPFRIFVDLITIFNSSPMQHLRWSSL